MTRQLHARFVFAVHSDPCRVNTTLLPVYLSMDASFTNESFISRSIAKPAAESRAPADLACRDRDDWYCLPVSFIIQSAASSRDGSLKSGKNFLALARKAKAPGNRQRERERPYIGISEHHWIARFIVDCRLSFRLTIHSISLGTIL